ncbi:hypothetical protein OF83DRAFT_622709 [Amylostereum chailletii]|nr:hypothetical protein OF83DRAFT_622709 [Amylostereum chailletii]
MRLWPPVPFNRRRSREPTVWAATTPGGKGRHALHLHCLIQNEDMVPRGTGIMVLLSYGKSPILNAGCGEMSPFIDRISEAADTYENWFPRKYTIDPHAITSQGFENMCLYVPVFFE